MAVFSESPPYASENSPLPDFDSSIMHSPIDATRAVPTPRCFAPEPAWVIARAPDPLQPRRNKLWRNFQALSAPWAAQILEAREAHSFEGRGCAQTQASV